jgi:hypothetical protein
MNRNHLGFISILVLSWCLGVSAAWSQASPAPVVQAFYADWLKFIHGHTNTPESKAFAAEQSRFDPAFFRLVTQTFQLAEKTKNEVAGYDEDPFFNTQDGVSGFRVGSATLHGGNATVPVYCTGGNEGKPAGKERLVAQVKLTLSKGVWCIGDVVYPGGGADASLRAWSQQLLKPTKG